LALVILGFSGFNTLQGVFMSAFGDSIVIQVLLTFIFIKGLDEAGVTNWLANWMITRKICVGRPWILSLMLFYASVVVGGFINLYGGVLLLWAVFYSMAKTFGYKKGDGYVAYMITCMMFLAAIGTMFLPFLPLVSIILGVAMKVLPNLVVPFGPWMILGIVYTIVMPIVCVLMGRFVFRFDLSKMANVDANDFVKAEKMNSEQKFAIITLVLFVAFYLLGL